MKIGMKTYLYIITFCLVITTQNMYGADNPIKGIWINEKYVSILNRTKSPFKAQQIIGNENRAIIIDGGSGKSNKVTLTYVVGSTEKKNVLDSLIQNKTVFMGYFVNVDTKTRDSVMMMKRENVIDVTVWNNGVPVRTTFNNVSPNSTSDALDIYVNSLVLAGKYTDDKNTVYELMPEGSCIWNGVKGKYELGFDFSLTKGDYVKIVVSLPEKNEKKKDTSSVPKKVPTMWLLERHSDRLILKATDKKEKDTQDTQLILFRVVATKP